MIENRFCTVVRKRHVYYKYSTKRSAFFSTATNSTLIFLNTVLNEKGCLLGSLCVFNILILLLPLPGYPGLSIRTNHIVGKITCLN